MKQVYDVKQLVRINGKSWEETSWRWHLVYADKEEYIKENSMYNKTTNWEDAMMFVEDHCLNGEVLRTFFGDKPYCLKTPQTGLNWTYTDKKHFKSIEIKLELEPFKGPMSVLMKNLSADELCEYLKDRGVQYVVES